VSNGLVGAALAATSGHGLDRGNAALATPQAVSTLLSLAGVERSGTPVRVNGIVMSIVSS